MKTLKESLLDNMEDSLEAGKHPYIYKYPVPTVKDFKKVGRDSIVIWKCPELIQQYADKFDLQITAPWAKPKEATGIACDIRSDKIIETALINEHEGYCCWLNAGDWYSNSLADAKKHCIWFLTELAKNPEANFKKLIDFHNKSEEEKKRVGFCDCKTYDKILK